MHIHFKSNVKGLLCFFPKDSQIWWKKTGILFQNDFLYILNRFSCTVSVHVLLYSYVSLTQKFRTGVYDNTSSALTINM